ncbi:hypothetical protein [Paenibacillus konkukensis]|nr:hypothetical protein [Paenibacillus konkukensis]
MTTAISVLLAVLLAACGASSPGKAPGTDSASASTSQSGNGQAASAAENMTRVFRDYAGHEVTMPAHPQRILIDQFMGHLLAVGVKPIGATSNQLSQFRDSSFLKPLGLSEGIDDLGNTISLEKAPAKVQEAVMDKEPSYLKASLETLPDYVGDYVFLTVYDWQKGDNAKLEQELKEAPLWRSLPVVTQNRVIQVNVNDFLPGDPISIEKQMEAQAKLLMERFKK